MKGITRGQAHRLRLIAGMIRHGIHGERYPSASAMAKALEVSWRTVIRDLECLRDDEGAPIAYDASRKGYYFVSAGWSLAPVSLTQKEMLAFALASRMFHPFRGTPMERDLQSLFGKIGKALDGSAAFSSPVNPDQVSFISDDYVPLDHEVWSRIAGHIQRREVIRVRYRTFSGTEKSYRLSPVHLTSYHGNWYMVAFRENKPDPSTFALSRLISIRPLKIASWASPLFDGAEFARTAFGITRGDKELKVHLRFSPRIATYIAERVWHPTQRLSPRPDGRLDVRMVTRGWKELVRWILSWQPDVEVLSPVILRNRVIEKMQEGLRSLDEQHFLVGRQR